MNTKLQRLFVMRHAESLEDIDKTAYERIADEDMPLTDNGRNQAKAFAIKLLQSLGPCRNLRLILSPSKRVLETAGIIVSEMPAHIRWSMANEHLIIKQNWGNVTVNNRAVIEKERYQTGVLRYQFPGGENGPAMLHRFGLFKERLCRKSQRNKKDCTLVITHGFEFRVLLKTLLAWTEEYFETLAHPHHCEMKRLTYDKGSFVLLDEMRVHDPSQNPNFIRRQL